MPSEPDFGRTFLVPEDGIDFVQLERRVAGIWDFVSEDDVTVGVNTAINPDAGATAGLGVNVLSLHNHARTSSCQSAL